MKRSTILRISLILLAVLVVLLSRPPVTARADEDNPTPVVNGQGSPDASPQGSSSGWE